MDPLDEFEFKPLTDGLGFHKTKGAGAQASASVNSGVKNSSLNPSFKTPLPRRREVPTIENENSVNNTKVDDILKSFGNTKNLTFDDSSTAAPVQRKASLSSLTELKSSYPHLMASLLDGMLVMAVSLLCMIILLSITKIDLVATLTNPNTSTLVFVSLFSLFLGVTLIYQLVNRTLMGATPGEWAFDLQLGTQQQMKAWSYPLMVLARIFLNFMTGFFVLPAMARLFKTDLAGIVTGLRIYAKV